MRENYDFSDAIKNPFADREKGKFTVLVHYDYSGSNSDNNGNRTPLLADYAKPLKENER
ncbi:MAG: hypothetical protein FWH17_01605 [Oscillospiraceae bacterium]|nr:hypothetical protein [Oscillospiraceae bacterium]